MITRRAVAVSALALWLAAPGIALGVEPERITHPVRATKDDLSPTRTYSSPHLAVDPRNPMNVVAAFVEMRSRRCGLLRSTDGGETWTRLDASPSPPSYPFCFHTSGAVTQTPVAFASDGTLYYALSGWDTPDGGARGNMSVLLGRSTDLGDSWRTTIVRNARGKEGEEVENNRPVSALAVHEGGVVYVGWRANFPDAKPSRAPRPMVAVSTDGGATFSEPIDAAAAFVESEEVRREVLDSLPPAAPSTGPQPATAAPTGGAGQQPQGAAAGQPAPSQPAPPKTPPDLPTNFGGANPGVAVDDKGTLYVAWVRSTQNVTPTPRQPMYLSRSTDRGKTFTVTEISPPNTSYGTPVLKWAPGGGTNGTLHVVYQAKRADTNVDDVFYRRSTDGGKTWSEQRRLPDDDESALMSHFLPNLTVAPDGRLDAAWWDFRNDPGTYSNDVYHASSTDDGNTWSKNVRVTERSINRKIGPWSNNFDMRQPPGIASTDALAVFAWDDTRDGDPVGQAQDIYSGVVQYEAIGGGVSSAVKYALAAVAALIVVGLVLLVLAFVVRRSAGGTSPPSAEAMPDRAPAGVG